ncbi:MAG: cache domain-containing protein [Bacteroidales bacterium]|nr:cache domain-containing protein [Bacteroidales bacterium]MCF8390728.1 cache domain-containing protein [Bacteroidales bacterium]
MARDRVKKHNSQFLYYFIQLFGIKSLSIQKLTLLLLFFPSFLSIGLIAGIWIYSETVIVHQKIRELEEKTIRVQKEKLKDEVYRVLSYLDYMKTYPLDDSLKNIQEHVLDYLKDIRFGNEGYIFINDYEGNALLFDGQKVIANKNIKNLTDPSGLKIFEKELELASIDDGGYFQYLFERISDTIPQPKMSYVKGFDDWGWIVGTGDYLDDIENEVNALEKSLREQLFARLLIILLVFLVVLLIIVLLSNKVAKAIQGQFNKFVSSLKIDSDTAKDHDPLEDMFIEDLKFIGYDMRKADELAKQFGDIIEQSKNEIYIFGVDDLIFIHANRGALKNCGYSMKQLSRMTPFDLMPEISREKFNSIVKPLKEKSKEQISFETINLRKNKSLYPAEIYLSRSVFYGQEVYVAFIYDISLRKRSERELIYARDKAKESDRLKSAFLANMSHEIRTPMNGILGFANLLKEKGIENKVHNEYVDIIERSGMRMLDTINSLMDISKIEAGQMDVYITDVDIESVMTELYEFFSLEAEKKGLTLIKNYKNYGKKILIQTDREKLYSILANLIKNAIKFTAEGSINFGFIINSPDDLKLNYSKEKSKDVKTAELVFYVKDTGIGIPEKRLNLIFERFMQIENKDKGVYEGTGLGLAISKAFVEMLGGNIWLNSEEGSGSAFYFSLPHIEAPALKVNDSDDMTITLQSGTQKKLKILIAEDNEIHAKLLSIITKDLSREIVHAKNGIEAIDLCKENPDFDLLLLDIKLPEKNGYEVAKQIRLFNKNIIIIAQTAFALVGDRDKAIEAGCNDYISKPVNKEELLAMINELTGLI